MKGRKRNITALPGALDKDPPAPTWLPKFAKTEWLRVVSALVKALLLAVIRKNGLTYVSPTRKYKRRPEPS